MSYERRGGGHRRRYRDDYDDRRRETYESPEDRLRMAIIKLGEVDAVEELPRLTKQIRELVPVNVQNISEGLRIAVTEQPFKIPYYAALVRLLHDPSEDATEFQGPSLGRHILEDFWKGFQAYLDKLAWREARFCIHFFAHLTVAGLVSPDSMFALLQSFTAVLDEFGVSFGRAKKAALCAAEGLMIAGPVLKDNASDIINAIQAFNDTTTSAKWLVQPAVKLYSNVTTTENVDELLDTILFALRTLNDSGFSQTADSFPQPYADYPDLDYTVLAAPFNLPSVLVPPEIIELDGGLSTESSEAEEAAQVKKEEWPEYFLRLFDNEISPDPNTPVGYAIRSSLLDIVDIFEVNRKECARLLLEYPKWNLPGTFKPKPGAPVQPGDSVSGKDWQLESTIIETILGALLILPSPSQKSVYHISLITELCKLSPTTVGPAVGKSIRKLYAALAEGLDVEAAKRFSEWFAVHMSNFGFQWVWKEWVPDLALAIQHPKRTFMRSAVELEIRLSYHDRILKTLPAALQVPEAFVIAEEAPGPDFEYNDPAKPHHDAAQSILNLFRGRAKAEDVVSHLDVLKTTILETVDEHGVGGGGGGGGAGNVDAVVRSIAVQSLLHVGSRSFSHLLNAIERYLPLLRSVTGVGASVGGVGSAAIGGGVNVEAKIGILRATARFWRGNKQMVGIVFDKFMQYQIVDPTDVVAWTFGAGGDEGTMDIIREKGNGNLRGWEWELVRAALDKANGRVVSAKRKVAVLRKEEDDTRAREKAGDVGMDVDADNARPAEEDVIENPALTTALKAFSTLTKEQKMALSRTLDGFVACLVPSSEISNVSAREVVSENAWHNRASWGREEWNAWETWGWYRQFCRAYSPYLRSYQHTLWAVSFAKYEGSEDPAVELMKRTWNIAVGQE